MRVRFTGIFILSKLDNFFSALTIPEDITITTYQLTLQNCKVSLVLGVLSDKDS